MASAKELAIKSFYIFHHVNKIPIKRIGVYPDERKHAIDMVIKNIRSVTGQDIEHEIYNIMIKYFVK